mmetsp:Transcript_27849/g.79882  ORF Transcript_27849/g.79882 Transcript_27849/m.79882 type:complete len:303 (-) Transcript_27849:147-1055(-)
MPPLALCLRRTFIDVDDGACAPVGARPRAQSAPTQSRHRSPGLFEDERGYVAELSESLGKVWNVVDASPAHERPGEVLVSMGSFRLSDGRDQVGNAAVSAALLRLKTQRDPEEEMRQVTSDTTASQGHDSPARNGDSETTSAGRVEQLLENIGSVGHPFLCSRPCLYFASGACANGSGCSFCHLPHAKRNVHLDKKHREIMRGLGAARAKALVVPLLFELLLAIDQSAASERAFRDFAEACEVSILALPAHTSRSERALVRTLSSMSFKAVLSAFQRTVGEADDIVRAGGDDLLRKLRDALP